jgi:hypothetical protein
VRVRVFATSRYEKEVRRLLTEPEQSAMQLAVAADAEAHLVVPGAGGVRKARWMRQSKGKSGGVRSICFRFTPSRKAAKRFVEGLKDAKQQAGN